MTLPAPSNTKGKASLSAETIAISEQYKKVMITLIRQSNQDLLREAAAGNDGGYNDN